MVPRLKAPAGERLFAGAPLEVLQIRLALLGFLALRLADNESTAAYIFRFVQLVVFRRVQVGVRQCVTLRSGRNRIEP